MTFVPTLDNDNPQGILNRIMRLPQTRDSILEIPRIGIEDVRQNRILEKRPVVSTVDDGGRVRQALNVISNSVAADNYVVPEVDLPVVDNETAPVPAVPYGIGQGNGTGIDMPSLDEELNLPAPPSAPRRNLLGELQNRRAKTLEEYDRLQNMTGKDLDKNKDKWYWNALKGALIGLGQASQAARINGQKLGWDDILGGAGAGAVANIASPHMDERFARDTELQRIGAKAKLLDEQISQQLKEQQTQAVIENYKSLEGDRQEDNRRKEQERKDKVEIEKRKADTARFTADLRLYEKSPTFRADANPEYVKQIYDRYGIVLQDKRGKAKTEFFQDENTGDWSYVTYDEQGNVSRSAPVIDKVTNKQLRTYPKSQVEAQKAITVAEVNRAARKFEAVTQAESRERVARLNIDADKKEKVLDAMNKYVLEAQKGDYSYPTKTAAEKEQFDNEARARFMNLYNFPE